MYFVSQIIKTTTKTFKILLFLLEQIVLPENNKKAT